MAHDDPYAGKTVTADWAYNLSRATTYTPALTASTTDPNLGADGSAVGWYHRGGHLIVGEASFHFSGSGLSAGSGTYEVSLPLNADTSLLTASNLVGEGTTIGNGSLRDDSAISGARTCSVYLMTAGKARLHVSDNSVVTDAAPWTWTTDDRINVRFTYLADPSVL